MVSKTTVAATLVLAGVVSVIALSEVRAGKQPPASVERLQTLGIETIDAVGSFQFIQSVKLNVEGSELGSVTFFMQTRSLVDGTISDLQSQIVDLREGPKGSSFIVDWSNFAIGQGALVEFFIWDANNIPLAIPSTVTVGV